MYEQLIFRLSQELPAILLTAIALFVAGLCSPAGSKVVESVRLGRADRRIAALSFLEICHGCCAPVHSQFCSPPRVG